MLRLHTDLLNGIDALIITSLRHVLEKFLLANKFFLLECTVKCLEGAVVDV